MSEKLVITKILSGRHLFLTGVTGFLGKVFLSTLIRNVPAIGSITCLVRRGKNGESAAARFRRAVWESLPLRPVRAELADREAKFLAERISIVEGDVTLPSLGLTAEAAEQIATRCDCIINIAGLVNFNPPLAEAVAVNVQGVQHLTQFATACQRAAFLHVSTCFVTGTRDGEVAEQLAPRDGFDHDKEIAALTSLLTRAAPEEATRIAHERARILGWPNLYTYTKALGEQIVAATTNLRFAIARPSIIESAIQYPEPGWNEGINTSAPLAFLGLLGQARYPCGNGVVLDVVPVDYVANALGTIAGALIAGTAQPCYQLGSSDTNPLTMREAIELTGLFKRRFLSTPASKELAKGLGIPNWLRYTMAQWEAVPISADHFRKYSAPALRTMIDSILPWVADQAKRTPIKFLAKPLHEAGKGLRNLAARSEKVFTQYLPFIHDHVYCFRTDGIRRLRTQLRAEERDRWRWAPEQIDWRHYWIDVHLRGLARHVFPAMTAKLQGKNGRPLLPHLSFLVPMRLPEGLKVRDLRLPKTLRAWTKRGFHEVQQWVYDRVFETAVTGRGHIPANRNVLVVANHSSHLDMGLVKYALGPYGQRLRALAAKDYFFRDGIRRIYFSNFTNLLPIDRSADLKVSLKPALDAFRRGEILLMFPEGTRTLDGTMGRFKRGVGYLALTGRIDILPIYLSGTFAAIPKGRLLIPQQRKLGAIIGPVIPWQELAQAVDGLPLDEAYRQAAAVIEQAVRQLQPSGTTGGPTSYAHMHDVCRREGEGRPSARRHQRRHSE